MLDKLCKKILKILTELCGDNSYSIIEIVEIVSHMSGKIDGEVLTKYIKYLSDNGYIDVKYIDDKQVCMAIMPKAKSIDEESVNNKKTNNKYIRMAFFMSLASLISGFIGAFLGSYFFQLLR